MAVAKFCFCKNNKRLIVGAAAAVESSASAAAAERQEASAAAAAAAILTSRPCLSALKRSSGRQPRTLEARVHHPPSAPLPSAKPLPCRMQCPSLPSSTRSACLTKSLVFHDSCTCLAFGVKTAMGVKTVKW